MKFLYLAGLLFAPAVWAAATPFKCDTILKSGYLYAEIPSEKGFYFNISDVAAGKDEYYIQKDAHPWVAGSDDKIYPHLEFEVARCQARNSSSTSPNKYVRVHLSKDPSKCLTMGGYGHDDDHKYSKGYIEDNTLRVGPCVHHNDPKFPLQLFNDWENDENKDLSLEAIESKNVSSRMYVGFSNNKVYLMVQEPDIHTLTPTLEIMTKGIADGSDQLNPSSPP